jgi:ABC-type lipoprotein export system ATPase subunit
LETLIVPHIEITNLKKHYSSGDDVVEALRGVDIRIETGESITIMGQSGSGKSTLLSALGGMNHPTTSEEVMALFRELNDAGQTVVMVTHNPDNGRYADRTITQKDGMVL